MDIPQRFMTYAADFEKTLADDDWGRLTPHFTDDAVYEVRGAGFDFKLQGRDAIFAGMKKSLNGFDRKFPRRDVELTSGPEVDGNEMRVGWKVTYHKEGLASFPLRGDSTARYRDDKIAHLIDTFDASVARELATWQAENGVDLDPSYA